MLLWKQLICRYLYAFLDYIKISGNDDIVIGSNNQLTGLDACEATVLTSLEHREKRGKNRHKVRSETFTRHVCWVVNKLTGRIRTFVQIRESDELEFPSGITESDLNENRKREDLHQLRRRTQVACYHSVNRIFVSVGSKLLTTYVGRKQGIIYECYSAVITECIGAVKLLRSDLRTIKFRVGSSVRASYCYYYKVEGKKT